jgi:hypothetical protein
MFGDAILVPITEVGSFAAGATGTVLNRRRWPLWVSRGPGGSASSVVLALWRRSVSSRAGLHEKQFVAVGEHSVG